MINILISFIVGALFGLYLAYRTTKSRSIELVQENDDGIDGNIQIGSITIKEK